MNHYREQQGSLLVLCLLERFCQVFDRDPEKNKALFHAMCRMLSRSGVISASHAMVEGTAPLRQRFVDIVIQPL